jgi:hypothetical protein
VFALVILFASLPRYLFGAQAFHEKNKPYTYRRVVLTGVASYRVERACIAFASFLTSDDFFEGLRPVETPAGRKFFKGAKEIDAFPAELTVEVQAVAQDCSKFPLEVLGSGATDSLLKALHFKLSWKTGLNQRPIRNFSLETKAPDSASWIEDERAKWRYDFNIQSVNVPLTDHLVIEIYSGAEHFLTRLSANL